MPKESNIQRARQYIDAEALNVEGDNEQAAAIMEALLTELGKLDDAIRDILDFSTGWSSPMSDRERLKRITAIGNAALVDEPGEARASAAADQAYSHQRAWSRMLDFEQSAAADEPGRDAVTVIRLDCGHWYDHRVPTALASAPDTVIGVGIKPPKMCPRCARGGVSPSGKERWPEPTKKRTKGTRG